MSYILNALRKSEQERLAKQNQTVANTIFESEDVTRRSSRWPIIVAVLVIINILVLSYLFLNNAAETTEHVVAQKQGADINQNVQQGKLKASEPKLTMVKKSKPETAIVSKVVKHDSGVVKSDQNQVKPAAVSADIKPVLPAKTNIKKAPIKPKKLVKSPSEPALKKAPQKVVKKSLKAKNGPISKVAETAIKSSQKPAKVLTSSDLAVIPEVPKKVISQPKPAVTPKAKKQTPWLNELSYEFRRKVPKININVFVYNENPKQAFVIVDMNKYKVGQELPDSMLLQQIRRNSLVVKYKNKVFRIKRP